MTATLTPDEQKALIFKVLEDMIAINPLAFFVQPQVGYTDWVIISSGRSTRHVKSIADKAEAVLREAGIKALGMEGDKEAEWVLVDFGDVILHVLTEDMRTFYQLEKLCQA